MINYKTETEREFTFHYAEKLDDPLALEILKRGEVKDAAEARHLSKFFWAMVDASIQDFNNGIALPWDESAEFISEKVMYAISGYLERAGYEEHWDAVSDEQDQ